MVGSRTIDINALENKIFYSFKNKSLIREALTHSSYANESKNKKLQFNERLEFLGDSVLSISMSDYLFHKFKDYPEGELTKIRAAVVSETSLYNAAKQIKLGDYLLLGKGEEASGGRQRPSILADTVEAIIGAIYLDSGLDFAKSFVYRILAPAVKAAAEGKGFIDYKTELQEFIQRDGISEPVYTIIDEKGPDHNKNFTTQVSCGNKVLGTGIGRSKKESEQNAAKDALHSLKD